MRLVKLLIFLSMMFLFSAVAVFGGSCTDSDRGPVDIADVAPFISQPGTSIDQFKTYKDVCVREELSDRKVSASPWLREFYCAGAIAKHKDFKCSDFGFENCITDDKGSYCKSNKPSAVQQSSSASAPKKAVADFYCGNKVMNRADAECYPPGKICIKDKLPGQCSSVCKCVVIGKYKDAASEAGKEPVEKSDASSASEKTKTVASLDIIVPSQEKMQESESEKTEMKEAAADKKEAQVIKQTVTLKVTAAVANTARSVWSKITGLF